MKLILVVIVALVLLAGADADKWSKTPRKRRSSRRTRPALRRNAPKRGARYRVSRPAPRLSLGTASRYAPSPARWWWE